MQCSNQRCKTAVIAPAGKLDADCPIWDHVVQLFVCCPGGPVPCDSCDDTIWLAQHHAGAQMLLPPFHQHTVCRCRVNSSDRILTPCKLHLAGVQQPGADASERRCHGA